MVLTRHPVTGNGGRWAWWWLLGESRRQAVCCGHTTMGGAKPPPKRLHCLSLEVVTYPQQPSHVEVTQ